MPGAAAQDPLPSYRFPVLAPGEDVLITHDSLAGCPLMIVSDDAPVDVRKMGLRMTNYALSIVFFDPRFASIYVPLLAFESLDTFKIPPHSTLATTTRSRAAREGASGAASEGVQFSTKTGSSFRFIWCHASRFVDSFYRTLPRSITSTFAFTYGSQLRSILSADPLIHHFTDTAAAAADAATGMPSRPADDAEGTDGDTAPLSIRSSRVPPVHPRAVNTAPCAAYWSPSVPLVLARPPERHAASVRIAEMVGEAVGDALAAAKLLDIAPAAKEAGGVGGGSAGGGEAPKVCPYQPYVGVPACVAVPDGWRVYCPRAEFARQLKLLQKNERRAWRLSGVNVDEKIGTYPSHVVVPASCSDGDCVKSALYRSRGRFPAVTWVGRGGGALARASQPLRGVLKGKSNARHDEGFLLAFAWAGFVEALPDGVTDAKGGGGPSLTSADASTGPGSPRGEGGKGDSVVGASAEKEGGGVAGGDVVVDVEVTMEADSDEDVEMENEIVDGAALNSGTATSSVGTAAVGGASLQVPEVVGAARAPSVGVNPFDASSPPSAGSSRVKPSAPPALFGGPTGLVRSATTPQVTATLPRGRSAASVDIIVVDARSQLVANANRSKGGGHEGSYRNTACLFFDIVNIHAVTDAWNRATRAAVGVQNDASSCTQRPLANLREIPKEVVPHESTTISFPAIPNASYTEAFIKSGWPNLTQRILWGSLKVADMLLEGRRVLVHCTDGWDRTAQLCCGAQIVLDPYFRTVEGFAVLVEKDWVSFGHKLAERCGHKLTCSADEVSRAADAAKVAAGAPQSALAAGLAGLGLDGAAGALTMSSATGALAVNTGDRAQVSPILMQWLDCVYQMVCQSPHAFEFTPEFLLCVVDAIYCGKYGTTLADCDAARTSIQLPDQTVSIWTELFAAVAEERAHCEASPDYLLPHRRLLNPQFLPPAAGGVRVLRFSSNPAHYSVWSDLFYRQFAETRAIPGCHPNAPAACDFAGRPAHPSSKIDMVAIYDTVLSSPSALGLGSVHSLPLRCGPRMPFISSASSSASVSALSTPPTTADEYLSIPLSMRGSDTKAARRRVEASPTGSPCPYALPPGVQNFVYSALPLARGAISAATAAGPAFTPPLPRIRGFLSSVPHFGPHPPVADGWGVDATSAEAGEEAAYERVADDTASPPASPSASPTRRGLSLESLMAAAAAARASPEAEFPPGAEHAIGPDVPRPYATRFAFSGRSTLGVASVDDPDQTRAGGSGEGGTGSAHTSAPAPSTLTKAAKCARCRESFSFFRRRHYCRLCNGQFCDSCSSKRVRSTTFSEGARVCDLCAGRVNPEDLLSG